jgi:hypothetical protein
MKAIRMHGRGGPEGLVYEDVPQPHPGQGEVLVRVYAAGVIAPELTWPETYQTKAGNVRSLLIPGHDLSGVVEEVVLVSVRSSEEQRSMPSLPSIVMVLKQNIPLPSPANWPPSRTPLIMCKRQPFR